MSVSSFPQLQFPQFEDWKTYKDAEASGVDDCLPDERAPMPVLSVDLVEPAYFPGDQKQRLSGRQEAKTRHKTRRPGRKKSRNGQHRPGLSVPVERIREPLEAWLAQPENTTIVLAARIGVLAAPAVRDSSLRSRR